MNSTNTVTRLVWVTLLLSSLTVSGCAALYYIDYTTSPKYPEDKSQEIKLEGLKKPVRVYLDEMGNPHLDASNEEDLMRDAGYPELDGHARHHAICLEELETTFENCRKRGAADRTDVARLFHKLIDDISKADLKFVEFLLAHDLMHSYKAR